MSYWVTGSVAPFDDFRPPRPLLATSTDNPAMNTSGSDAMRQGVEMRRVGDLLHSLQPKFWGGKITNSGTLTHEQDFRTYGQAVSFSEFFATQTFEEKPKWNPIDYIAAGNSYPLPIIVNYGPQEQQEAIIEPFTLFQRLNYNEGMDTARTMRGELEDGNHADGRLHGNSVTAQFIEYDRPLIVRPWLDEGARLIGAVATGSVRVPGYVAKAQRVMSPFIDDGNTKIIAQVSGSTDPDMSVVLVSLQYGMGVDTDMRPRGMKASTSGFVLEPCNARAGTDSVAFNGWTRGS